MGQLSDFYDAIRQCDLKQLPVVRGDMPDCWIHGVASSPMGDHLIAEMRPLLTATEELATLNAAWGLPSVPSTQAVSEAYTQSLLWSEHTWGLASQRHVTFKYEKQGQITTAMAQPPEGVKAVEASWQEHMDYARSVQRLLEKPCAEQMRTLAAAVSIVGKRIVVFNPLPWTRDDVVTVSGEFGEDSLLQTDDGTKTPADLRGNMLRFVARGVPSFGYRTYRVLSGAKPSTATGCRVDLEKQTIESPAFCMVFTHAWKSRESVRQACPPRVDRP